MTEASSPSTRFKVKVVPGSSRDEIVGWLGDALKIKVTAPPEKGKANEAVVELLATWLGLSAEAVAVVRRSLVTIQGHQRRWDRC